MWTEWTLWTWMMIPRNRFARFVAGLFFFSGFSALIYQVTWARRLSLFFGSDVYSTAITLSAFMAGLSLGSYIAEKVVDRVKGHLLYYGIIELCIGVYSLCFSALLHAFTPELRHIYQTCFETAPLIYQAARIMVAALVLLPPTTLMGATLPLVVKTFVRKDSEMGRFGGFFYSTNTFGALTGVMASAFVLIPIFGIEVTTWIAAGINAVVGTAVLVSRNLEPGESGGGREEEVSREAGPGYNAAHARRAVFCIGLSGLAALALEVVWTRILTLSFSATVYSFSVMLVCFLFGIYLGSRVVSKRVDSLSNPMRDFGVVETWLGASVAFLGVVSYIVPPFFGKLVWALSNLHVNFGVASNVAEFLVAGMFIMAPTTLLGATFPIAVRICTPDARRAGFGTGRVYASNTAGAILGALIAGFALIPAMGSYRSLLVIAGLFFVNGLVLLRPAGSVASAAWPAGVLILSAIGTVALPRQTVINYNQQNSTKPELIYHGEGISHSVDIVRSPNRDVIMMVDGNIEADTSFTQRRHFILKAHLPLLLHPHPHEVAVVGLGLGITLAATARNPEVEHVQVIELSPEMVEAHKYLKEIDGGVLGNPKVSVRLDDGRNYFSMTDRTFDMITADPIHPRITGVGYLYTEEYYKCIKQRLKPGGVVCQWMPMYNISRRSFDVAFRTFSRVFGNASFWYVRGHGLFVATESPFTIDFADLARRMGEEPVASDMASIDIHGPEEFLAHLLMGPKQIQQYLAAAGDEQVNTDANAYLEYHTPSEFLDKTKDIVAALAKYAGYDPEIIRNVPAGEREKIRAEWDRRQGRLLPELDEALR